MRKLFSLFLAGIFLLPVCAQENLNLGLKAHKGFIWVHRENMGHLVKGHPNIFELTVALPTYGEKHWQQIYQYPEVGLSLLYVDMANPKQLGAAYSIIPNINFPLSKNNRVSLSLRAGVGAGYLTRKYDRLGNHKNNAYSTALNGAVNFQLENRINLTEKLSLRTGLAFTHFSNGAYRMPNLGINIVTANTGLHYTIGESRQRILPDTSVKLKKPFNFYIVGITGIKSLFVLGGQYPSYAITSIFERHVSHKSSFGFGFDLNYNTSIIDKLQKLDGISIGKREILQSGMHFSYALNVSRLSLFINKGLYLRQVDNHTGKVYHRLGLRYRFNNRIIGNFSLKTHYGVADYFEYGIGYSFRR